jgi:osmotically inducible protein OsmC
MGRPDYAPFGWFVDPQLCGEHYSKTNSILMNIRRKASAVWNGTGKEGNGTLTTGSTALNNTQYSFNSRFAEGAGTNPEELIAAAHAGCFSMKLAFVLGEAGITPRRISTDCTVTLQDGAVTKSELMLRASIDGGDEAGFRQAAEKAKAECPISKLLTCEITLDTQIESA